MKLWVDDVRPAPKGYVWCNSVNDAIITIKLREARIENILREYTPQQAEELHRMEAERSALKNIPDELC